MYILCGVSKAGNKKGGRGKGANYLVLGQVN